MGTLKYFSTIISSNPIVIFGSSQCIFCERALSLVKMRKHFYVDIVKYAHDNDMTVNDIMTILSKKTDNYKYIPIVFIKGKFIGGYTELKENLMKSK